MSDTPLLSPGSAVPISGRVVGVDVRWSAGAQTAFAERIGVAALPYVRGRIPGREHLVFVNQPSTPDGGVRLALQNDVVEVEVDRLPLDVERVAVVVYVAPRPNAPRRSVGELDSLSVTVHDSTTREVWGTSMGLQGLAGSAAALTVCDLVRKGPAWDAVIQAHGHEGGLDTVAAAAGLRL